MLKGYAIKRVMMSELMALAGDIFLVVGVCFFVVGTIGVIRFFDLYTKLHALAKIDNVGLGFITFGLMLQSDSILVALKIFLIWVLVLLCSSTLSYILSSHSNKTGEKPQAKEVSDDIY